MEKFSYIAMTILLSQWVAWSEAAVDCRFEELHAGAPALEIFESVLGELNPEARRALATSTPSPFPPKERAEIFKTFEVTEPARQAELSNQIDMAFGAMLTTELDGKPISRETAVRLTRFVAEKLIHPERQDTVVVDRFAHGESEFSEWNYQDGNQTTRRQLLNQTIRDIHTHLAGSEIPSEPNPSMQVFLTQLISDLFHGAKMGKEYTQARWLQNRLLGSRDLTEPQRDIVYGWIIEEMKRVLKEEYSGFEGMLKHAEEFRRGGLGNSWFHVRTYLDLDFLKSLGWRRLEYYIHADGYRKLERDIETNPVDLRSKYAGKAGRRRLSLDYFGKDNIAVRPVVRSLMHEDQYAAMGWNKGGDYVSGLVDVNGRVAKQYRTRAGFNHYKTETALHYLEEDVPGFPTEYRFQTRDQQDLLKEKENEIHETVKRSLRREIVAEANWGFEPIDLPLSRAALLKRYSGPGGLMAYARASNIRLKKLVSYINKKYGKGTSEALGWRTTFLGVGSATELKEQVLLTPKRPADRYKGLAGLQRLSLDRDENTHTTRGSVRSALTDPQYEKLGWTNEQTEPLRAEWRLAVEFTRSGRKTQRQISNFIRERADKFPPIRSDRLKRALHASPNIEARLKMDNGELNPLFLGRAGLKHYASQFHSGRMDDANFTVELALGPEAIKGLGWSAKKKHETPEWVREEARKNRWVVLIGDDGNVDPYLKGSVGWLRYTQLKENLSLAQARDHARKVLSEREWKSLGWDTTAKLNTEAAVDHSPWSQWSPAQKEAATAYLGFVLSQQRHPKDPEWKSKSSGFPYGKDQFYGEGDFALGKKNRHQSVFPDRRTALEQVSQYATSLGMPLP